MCVFFLHNDVFASFWVLLHLTGYVLMGATCSDLFLSSHITTTMVCTRERRERVIARENKKRYFWRSGRAPYLPDSIFYLPLFSS